MVNERGKVRPWIVPLLEWTPEKLPGYDEVMSKLARGESLFPKPEPVTSHHVKRVTRSLESLTAERDRLLAKRDGATTNEIPDDPGALSGIRKPNASKDRKSAARTDRMLEQYVTLSQRIAYLEGRMSRAT